MAATPGGAACADRGDGASEWRAGYPDADRQCQGCVFHASDVCTAIARNPKILNAFFRTFDGKLSYRYCRTIFTSAHSGFAEMSRPAPRRTPVLACSTPKDPGKKRVKLTQAPKRRRRPVSSRVNDGFDGPLPCARLTAGEVKRTALNSRECARPPRASADCREGGHLPGRVAPATRGTRRREALDDRDRVRSRACVASAAG